MGRESISESVSEKDYISDDVCSSLHFMSFVNSLTIAIIHLTNYQAMYSWQVCI